MQISLSSLETVTWLGFLLTSVSFSVSTLIQQEELIRWHEWVTRTRIQVTEVNVNKMMIKGKEILFELAGRGIQFIRVRVNRGKMTEK